MRGYSLERRSQVLRVLHDDFGLAELTRQFDGVNEAVVLSLR